MQPERALRPAARPGPGSAPATRASATRAYAPAARGSTAPDPARVLVIGCGALARELVAVVDQAGLDKVDLTCLPATLHNRPGGIPAAVRAKIRAARPRYDNIFIAYADCGTGGVLDRVLAEEGVERLPGAHCYEFFSGSPEFAAMMDEEPGTFFLTDFLARNFERLVWVGLGLDRHPELLTVYFGAYKRVVYLAQTDDPALVVAARRAAKRLGLDFELRRTGYGDLAVSIVQAATAAQAATPSHPRTAPIAPRGTLGADAIARDGTNGARDSTSMLSPSDSDHLPQASSTTTPPPARFFRQTQAPQRAVTPSRRWLHPTQGAARVLHPVQDPTQLGPDTGLSSVTTATSTGGEA